MTKTQLIAKWTLLVWLNAGFSFFLALSGLVQDFESILGMVLGVFTFVALYSYLDYRLLQQGKNRLRKWLLIAVILKAFTQLAPMIEILSGMAAVGTVEVAGQLLKQVLGVSSLFTNDSFISVYFITIICATLLSLVVGFLVLIVKLFATIIIPHFKKPKELAIPE